MTMEHRTFTPVVAAAAFLCAAMPAAAQSPDDLAGQFGLLPGKPKNERQHHVPQARRKGEPEVAFGTVENDIVITPDGRRFPVTRERAMFSELEMTAPVGAKVELFHGTRRVYTNDIPFIWNHAKSSEYVKIQVTEGDRVWAFKILPEQGARLVIGRSAVDEPPARVVKKVRPTPAHPARAKPTPTKPAGYAGQYISMERLTFRHGDAIDVLWHGTPGNSMDWVTVVPAGSPPGEWGMWSYTSGEKAGKRRISGLKPGRYEARISFNSSNDIEDRVEFTVTE